MRMPRATLSAMTNAGGVDLLHGLAETSIEQLADSPALAGLGPLDQLGNHCTQVALGDRLGEGPPPGVDPSRVRVATTDGRLVAGQEAAGRSGRAYPRPGGNPRTSLRRLLGPQQNTGPGGSPGVSIFLQTRLALPASSSASLRADPGTGLGKEWFAQ